MKPKRKAVKGILAPWNDPEVVWVCENHPTKRQEHRLFPFFWKRCGGAGMPKFPNKSLKAKKK